MKHLACALVLAGLSLAPASHARQVSSPDACASAANTVDMEKCLDDQLDKANHQLDGLAARIDGHLKDDAATLTAFHAAQAAWRNDLALTCEQMDSVQYGEGTMHLTEPTRCAVRMTRERTALLQSLFYVMLND